MGAGARHLIAHSGSQGLSVCTISLLPGLSADPPPPRSPSSLLSSPSVACRFAPRCRRSCATQPAGRVGGPARVEFSPQAGQPNGNKKLRQTALPTPRRPVNIATEREREGQGGRKRHPQRDVNCPRQRTLWIKMRSSISQILVVRFELFFLSIFDINGFQVFLLI